MSSKYGELSQRGMGQNEFWNLLDSRDALWQLVASCDQ